jgi:hypothetical protein
MPPRSNEFQRLIYLIERQLGAGGTVRESAMLADASGGEAECDVLIERSEGERRVRIAVEVRDQKRKKRPKPGDKTWIEQIYGKYASIQVDDRVAVSRGGFTKGARRKAAYLGVKVMDYAEAARFPWAKSVNEIESIALERHETRIVQVNIRIVGAGGDRITTRPDLCSIIDANGTRARLDRAVYGDVARAGIRTQLEQNAKADERGWAWLAVREIPGWQFSDEVGNHHEIVEYRALLQPISDATVVKVNHGTYGEAAFFSGYGLLGSRIARVIAVQTRDGADNAPIHIELEK